jgi:hypothetical protein
MSIKTTIILLAYAFFPSVLLSETKVTAYFLNDSVNGFKISDAYETHNMGILWEKDGVFANFDLGIVSPDMHVYKNQYRTANRSFGEIVSVMVGKREEFSETVHFSRYLKLQNSGTYGIDKLQDITHKLLSLQPVNQVNNLVRMPNKTWIGIGGQIGSRSETIDTFSQLLGFNYYVGTDKIEISPFTSAEIDNGKYVLLGEIGLNLVQFDKIVTAPPISAEHRKLIPYIELGINFEYLGLGWYLRDRFSLPTVNNDDSIFGVLSAGVTFYLE